MGVTGAVSTGDPGALFWMWISAFFGMATAEIVQHATGNVPSTEISWIFFLLLTCLITFSIFGGLKRIVKITDVLVPTMAIIYVGIVPVMILINLERLPWFFYAVVTEAFRPDSIFGGTLGIALSQGIKRGLMSNEA